MISCHHYHHLFNTCAYYYIFIQWAKCEMEETITNEMDGDLQAGLLAVVKSLRKPMSTKIDSLHNALQSGDKNTVARLVAASDEVGMFIYSFTNLFTNSLTH